MVGKEGAGGRKENKKGGKILDLLSYNAGNPLRWPQGCRGGGKKYTKLRGCQEVNKQEKWGRERMGEELGETLCCLYMGQEEGQVSEEMENQIKG